ncbi:hypothetical protein Aperf_G00000041777 [Anoplocephala perfoliata]
MELERLKLRTGGTKSTSNGENGRASKKKSTSNLEEHIAGLVQDRDYWKGQVDHLSQMLACPSIVGFRNAKSFSTGSRISSAPKPNTYKSQRDDRRHKENTKVLQEARRENRQMKCRMSPESAPFTRSRSLPREHSCEKSLENQKLRLERDELQIMLNRFEKRIQEIQNNVQVLTKERDDLNRLYADAKNEIHRLHHDLYDVQNATKRRAASQELSTRLQIDLDQANREIVQLTAEKESLAAKYKFLNNYLVHHAQPERGMFRKQSLLVILFVVVINYCNVDKASEMESMDKLRHSKQMDYMEKALNEATNERDEVVARFGQLKRRLEELQSNQMKIEQRLSEKSEKLKNCTEESNNLRRELESRQRVLEETETKLTAIRNRGGELEAVCQQSQASAEEAGRLVLLERETNTKLQAELQEATLERKKMQANDDSACFTYFINHFGNLNKGFIILGQEIEDLMRAKSQLQKNNKYLEKKCMTTMTERDEVNTNCNRLAADINSLEQKLKSAEKDIASCNNKFQMERSAKESLADRCMLAERRLEECEFRGQNLSNELRENQDVRYHLERQAKNECRKTGWGKRKFEEKNILAAESGVLCTMMVEIVFTTGADIDLANKDKVKLEGCIEDLTAANRQLIRDRDDCTHRHTLARERITELEADLGSLEADVKRQTEVANKEHQCVVDQRKENDSLKQRCEELNAELVEVLNRQRNAEERSHQAEIRATQLERELRMEHDDYLQVRSRLEATEEQRDAGEANRKLMAQRISELEMQLTTQLMEIKETRNALDENARILSRKEEQLLASQASEQSLRSELAAAQSNIRESRRALDAGEQETIRIRDELACAMRDIQRLTTELHASPPSDIADDREALKTRVEGYLSELARQERLLDERARERDLLAEQARTAAEDAELWRARWTEAEAAAANARLQSDERSGEVLRLRDTLEAKDRELTQCKTALSRAELQVQNLGQQNAESAESAGLARAEVETLSSEVSRLREALGRAEAARGAVECEAVHARVAAEEARVKAAAAEADAVAAHESAAVERENARNANLLLQSVKEKERDASAEAQERANEVMALRERAVLAEERAEAQQREMARLYDRLAESEKAASRLSRSFSTERFERDRERFPSELRSFPAVYRIPGYSGSSGRYTTSRLRSPHRDKDELN